MDPESKSYDIVLPPELFRPIIQHLSKDRKALCALSLACKMLQEEGQRQLYQKITLSGSIGSHIKFLQSILDNNRLALYVHEYRQKGLARYQGEPLWGYLCRGLRAMVNLKVLKFKSYQGQASAEILGGCTFQLQSLVWGNLNDEDHLSQFLRSQYNLQKLGVAWADSKRGLISPSFCPALIALRGNRGTVETFLPGRKITSLAWVCAGFTSHSMEHLSSCLSQIRFFAFGNLIKPYPNFIVPFLPSLEVIELKLYSENSEETMMPLIPHLKELRTLVISARSNSWGGSPMPSNMDFQLFIHLFENCEKLKEIHFSVDIKNYETYRWIAGSLDVLPASASYEEVHRWWNI